MTCPGTDGIKWSENAKPKGQPQVQNDGQPSVIMEYEKKGIYHCEYKDGESPNQKTIKFYFYVQGKGEFKKKVTISHHLPSVSFVLTDLSLAPLLCFDPQCVTTVMN